MAHFTISQSFLWAQNPILQELLLLIHVKLLIWSGHNIAHAKIAQLLWDMQNGDLV